MRVRLRVGQVSTCLQEASCHSFFSCGTCAPFFPQPSGQQARAVRSPVINFPSVRLLLPLNYIISLRILDKQYRAPFTPFSVTPYTPTGSRLASPRLVARELFRVRVLALLRLFFSSFAPRGLLSNVERTWLGLFLPARRFRQRESQA